MTRLRLINNKMSFRNTKTYGRTLEGSTAFNSIERFFIGQSAEDPIAKKLELMQFCIDTVVIVETVVENDVLVDVKVTVDTDGNSREFFSWL